MTRSNVSPRQAFATSTSTILTFGARVATFFCSQGSAASEFSTAVTVDFDSVASAMAIHPDPEPRSITLTFFDLISSSANATSDSVSGRGISTPGPTSYSRYRKGALPVMY